MYKAILEGTSTRCNLLTLVLALSFVVLHILLMLCAESPYWPPWFSPDALNICQQLLQRDPNKRLSDPRAIKAHPFFKGIDWLKLLAKEVTPPYLSRQCFFLLPFVLSTIEFLTLKLCTACEIKG